MTGRVKLLAVSETQYGDEYKADYMRLFRDYVASASQISERRHKANTFFSSINTLLLTASGFISDSDVPGFNWQIAVAGGLLCLIWRHMIITYRGYNSAKFKVINEMEQHLPVAAYSAEWHYHSAANSSTLTNVEKWVPLLFAATYIAVFIMDLWIYS